MIKLFYTLILLLLIIGGCKSDKSGEQEIQKLLELQSVKMESQQESVANLQRINDSLADEKKMLLQEKNQQILLENIKNKEQSELSSEKTSAEVNLITYSDSLDQLKNKLASIDVDIDSIEKSMDLFEMQEGLAARKFKSGIDEIDQRITKLQNQKQQEIKKAELLKKRSAVAEKKIEAYQLERQMYVDQRDELLRMNASDEQIQPYRKRIAEMDSTITNEETNKKAIGGELDLTNQWISGVDKMINDMQEEIKMEYDRNNIIEGYINSEKQRLQKEIDFLQSSQERMVMEQEQIIRDLDRSEEEIATLDNRMELIKNKDMSSILKQQAANEQSEVDLAEEEILLYEESTALDMQSLSTSTDTVSDEFKSLVTMSNQLDSLRASIQEEKTEVTKTRKELSEKRAETAETRARTGSGIARIALIIVIVGLVLLTLFYYIGRKAKKS